MDANVELGWIRVWCEQPSVALHSEKLDAFMVVHGDDLKTLGNDEALSEVERVMSSHCAIKVRAVLGAGRDDAKEVRILDRYVRWNSDCERSLSSGFSGSCFGPCHRLCS